MSNETTQNFLDVMATFEWPEPPAVFFRLYYNDDGSPNCYSMEQLPGKYINIDSDLFASRPWNVRVINEKLHYIQPPIVVKKLVPSADGIACDPSDVCVVVDKRQAHVGWEIKTYEIN